MEYFIDNLKRSLEIDIPLISLIGAFVLIDAVSAYDTEEGIASQKNFTQWLEKYLPGYIVMGVNAIDYYKHRCALLHQLSGAREDISISTLLFFPKNSHIKGHMNIINCALNLDITTFVMDVINAARMCIEKSIYYKNHKDKIITLHEDELAFYTQKIAVIGSKVPAKGKK